MLIVNGYMYVEPSSVTEFVRDLQNLAITAHLQATDTTAFVGRWGRTIRGEISKYDALNERGLMDE